jgi:hypothetical protein
MKTLIALISLLFCASVFAQEKVYQGAAGQTVTMTASADGTAPFTYQWYKDGTAITGTGATQVFPLSAATAGAYTVKITNPAGSATSAPAKIVLIIPPSNVRLDATINVTVTSAAPAVK